MRASLPGSIRSRVRHEVRSRLSAYPALYLPFARRKYASAASPSVVDGGTEVVIDGFQRSGNTFAVTAFRMAQDRDVAVAHHLHCPAQIVWGARRGLPVMLLVREPSEAVLSFAIRYEDLTLRQCLRHYVRFHRRLLGVRSSVLIAPFEELRRDFGAVIRRLNEACGTAFAEFEHTEENLRRCWAAIERDHRATHGGVRLRLLAVPSAERSTMKAELRSAYDAPRLAPLRRAAEGVYRELVHRG